MTAIEEFVIDKMSSYVAGGATPKTAARFTRGELLASYKGDHWSRDAAGKPQKTPPPEALDIETAMRKCDEAIAEILDYCAKERPQSGMGEMHSKAPDKSVQQELTGFEKMAEYARNPA
jgi:hypothetical protein